MLSASSLTLPPLSPLPLGSWFTCLSPYVQQGPWLWSHLLSHFCLLPFPILISLLHIFPRLSCLSCLSPLVSLVCLLWLVALCVCVCVDLCQTIPCFCECLCCHVFYLPCASLLRSHECAHVTFAMCRLVTSPQKGARQIQYIAIDHHCCICCSMYFS